MTPEIDFREFDKSAGKNIEGLADIALLKYGGLGLVAAKLNRRGRDLQRPLRGFFEERNGFEEALDIVVSSFGHVSSGDVSNLGWN